MVEKRSLNGGRVTRPSTPAPPRRPRRDNRRLMVQIVAALLVLAMLMPVIAFFL